MVKSGEKLFEIHKYFLIVYSTLRKSISMKQVLIYSKNSDFKRRELVDVDNVILADDSFFIIEQDKKLFEEIIYKIGGN